MKFDKVLTVDGTTQPIVSDSMTLELGTPGRGIFIVRSEEPVIGTVVLKAGVDGDFETVFTGYVDVCRQIDAKQQRLTVRECGAALSGRWTMAFRNTRLKAILTNISLASGVAFQLGDITLGERSIPHFVNIGTGYEALDLLGRELDITDYIWQCQPDGSIYIGNRNGIEAFRIPLAIGAEFFTDLSAAGAGCPYVPGFRPGRRLRIGNSAELVTISKINVSAESMRLNFEA